MAFECVTAEEAVERPGLRMAVVGGVPSPWGEAAKGILHVKGIDWKAVQLDYENGLTKKWTGLRNAPVAVNGDEKPRSGWADILLRWQNGWNHRRLASRLHDQREAGSNYFIGDGITAVYIYSATAMALYHPLPPEDCAMRDSTRAAFELRDDETDAALDPILFEHWDRIYAQYLELPLSH